MNARMMIAALTAGSLLGALAFAVTPATSNAPAETTLIKPAAESYGNEQASMRATGKRDGQLEYIRIADCTTTQCLNI